MQHISSDVAFSAKMPAAEIPLLAGVRVVFQDVIINIGNGYNATNGIFTVPVSGTYSFALTNMPTHSTGQYSALTVNGEVLCIAYSPSTFVIGEYVTGCNNYVLPTSFRQPLCLSRIVSRNR